MKPQERVAYLAAIARLATVDAEATNSDPLKTFLPLPNAARSLAEDVWIILGSRGTGKTALFRLATTGTPLLAGLFGEPVPEARWLDCFSVMGHEHPEVSVLECMSDLDDLDLRGFWAALLLRRLAQAGETAGVKSSITAEIQNFAPNAATRWAPGIKRLLGDLIGALDQVDTILQATGRRVFCCYDALDRISPFDGQMRRRHIRVLLSLWSSLSSRHRYLRAKVFLRDDLLDAKTLDFPDASKLRARAASLRWSHEDLSRLIVRYLAQDSDAAREWLTGIKQLKLRYDPNLGWLPGAMPEAVRTAFTNRMTGTTIGTGIFRVEPGRWIVGRLQDANDEISPRTTLRFFGYAGREGHRRALEQSSRSPILLSDSDLSASIRRTSADRVTELREEYPIVNRMENLSDLTIPIRRADAEVRLGRPATLEDLRGEHPGDAVLEELGRLGVVSEYGALDALMLDVPDIYRYGFGIGIDYSEAFRSYIMHEPASMALLQRGDLPQVDALIAKADHDGSIIRAAIKEAWDRYLSGNTTSAIRLLKTVDDLAQRKNDPALRLDALFLASEVYLMLDPEISIVAIELGRAVLRENPLPGTPRMEMVLTIQECCALISLHRPEQARSVAATLAPLEEPSSGMLRDQLPWIYGQIALFSGDATEAGRFASMLAEDGDDLSQWRGYLIAASLVVMRGRAPKDCLGSGQGMLPWALSLEGVTETQLRAAALLAYLPACNPDVSEIVRKGAEQIASAYIAQVEGFTLDDLRTEAGLIYTQDKGQKLFRSATIEHGLLTPGDHAQFSR